MDVEGASVCITVSYLFHICCFLLRSRIQDRIRTDCPDRQDFLGMTTEDWNELEGIEDEDGYTGNVSREVL